MFPNASWSRHPGPRAAGLAVVLLLVVLGTLGAGSAPADVDRVIGDARIDGSSGLAASLLHPGVVWTLNDSGHPAQLFAINQDGSIAATITVAGETARDWEAITTVRNPAGDGRAYLAIGDIGDDDYQHASGRIILVPEPDVLVTQTVRPQRVVRFGYPDRPRDAEALLADPRTGLLYVVTRDLYSSEIFVIRASAWPETTTGVSGLVTLQRVATSTASLITDGTFLPGGRMLLRSYVTLYLLDAPGRAVDGRLPPLDSLELPVQPQGESLTTGDGGRTALIGSEGVGQPVLRLDLAAIGLAGGAGPAGASAGADVRAGTVLDGAHVSTPGAPGIGVSGNTLLAAGAGLAVLTLLAYGIVTALTRFRRTRRG